MENRAVKILAIDDNKDNLTILKALIMESFTKAIVLTAFTGQKGLEIAGKEDPDVILLDIIMPGMDGYETCRKLKADKKLCDIPVVFVTAIKSDKASRVKALESGADAFLTKPIDESELTAQIRAMLKISEANLEKRDEKQLLATLVDEKTRELRESNAKTLQLLEEIKQSEERFQLLFNKAPLGYQSLDIEGRFIEVNQKWLDTLGYSREEVIGKWFGDFLCSEYVEGFRQRFPIFKAKGHIHSEFEMLTKDGQKLIIAFEGKIANNAEGEFKQTHCILQDITEQRKAEKALIESENRYMQLSVQSRTFTWETDELGIYTFVDNVSEAVLGYRSEELIQKKHFYDLCPEEDREELKQTALDIFERKGLFRDMENKALTNTGDIVILSTNGFPILKDDGSLLGYRGSDTDITDRKQIEESLRKSEERFRVAQEISPDGFTILRPFRNKTGEIIDFTFVYENQAIALINQTDPQKVIGKRLLSIFPTHKGSSIFEAYTHVANTGKPQILKELNVEELVSKPKWLRLVVMSMGDEIAVLAQDITKSKQTEKELLRFAEELEQQRKNLEKRLLQSVNAISKIGEIRDTYTAGHQRRVETLSCAIGSAMGLVAEQIDNLSFGALIHDIGKLFIPSEILNKPGKISSLEYKILQTHVEESYNVVKEIDFPEEIHTMIYQHHERLDGSGYPQGLSSDEIILESRILAVADVVEAINSHRPYREALGIDAALEEIMLHRGTKYDAKVVDICVKLFKEDGYTF